MKKVIFLFIVLLSLSACSTAKEEEYFNNAADAAIDIREKLVNKVGFELTYVHVVDPSANAESSYDYIIKMQFEYLKPDNTTHSKIMFIKVNEGKYNQSDFTNENQKAITSQYELLAVTPYRLNTEKINNIIKKKNK